MAALPPRSRWCLLAWLVTALTGCTGHSSAPSSSQSDARRPPEATITSAGRVSYPDLAAGIGAVLAGTPDEGRSTEAWTELRRLYAADHNAPLWVEQDQVGPDGQQALAMLRESGDDGLEPSDYGVASIQSLAERRLASTEDAIRLEINLSAGVLRYLRDLHLGRVDPRDLGFPQKPTRTPRDFAALVRAARSAHRVRQAASDLRPALGQYDALRARLGAYRRLSDSVSQERLPDVKLSVHPGTSYAGLVALRGRLATLGDLPPSASPRDESERYEGATVHAVTRFQRRHGLDADGVLGQRTVDALNVPLTWRVRQIELALERLRWLPDFRDEPLIALNIPMFRLWAWDGNPAQRAPSLTMAAIVGRAISWQTPVFDMRLRQVIFQPYWNVPRSILRHEILPRLARDPAYLGQQNFEIVRGETDEAARVEPTPENLALLRQGVLRLRQRPGPLNALGGIKFVFPNDQNVYMHATPATELFKRSRRDFSHGCVRLEQPVELAEWVLRGMPDWGRDRIVNAMHGSGPAEVQLPRSIRVVLFYTTASVMSADGTIYFADDIYGFDRPLDEALRRR
jgi:L,D-transpeptidase YcbB